MKKLLACIVLVLACLTMTFMACQPIDSSSTEGPATIQDARTFLKAMYKDAATVTPSDYERVAMLSLTGTDGKDYLFPVEWSAVVTTEGAPEGLIKVTKNEDGKAYTIDVDEDAQQDYEYTLTATIKNAEGTESLTLDFKYTLPKFHVSTYAEYVDLEKDKAVTVEGIITAITSKTLKDSNNCLYVNDLNNEGGYYVYQMTEDPLTESFENINDASKKYALAVGMKVQVRGVKDNYSGTLEIKSPKVTILDSGVTEVTPVDFTEIYKAAAAKKDLKATDLVYKQALLVKISGVEITGQDTDSGYYKFKLDGLESYVRISSSVCPLNAADTEAFIKLHTEKFGNIADVCGVVCVYDGAFYLTPVDVDAFSNFTLPPKTPAEQVAFEKEALTVTANITEDGQLELNAKGTAYTDVTIAWALDKTYPGVTLNKNILTVELQETAQTIKLTATLTNGDESDTKEFEVLIDAKETTEYEPVIINAPADGEYKIVMDTTALGGGILYFDGTINSKGALVSTDKANKAATVVVAAVEGKEGVYTLKVGDKYLVGYLNGNYNNLKLADEAGEWTWNDDIKTFVTTFTDKNKTESTFYFGTHSKASSKDTFALSYISYVTGDNAANIGVTQIVGQFATLQEVEYVPVATEEAVAGEYKIFMDTTALGGGILYFDGTINSKGALVSTDKANKAATVVVAAVEGKEGVYTLKVGDKYLVGYLNGNYNNLKLADEAGEWTWNADIKTFVTTFTDKNKTESTFYFGTHSKASSKDTFALSYISYVTGDNAANIGVTQIVGYFGTMQKKSNVPEPTDEEKLAAIVKKLKTTVTADFELDSTVTWTVKSGEAITIEGNTAKVTRPAAGAEDATVVLTATLGNATQDVTITVTAMPGEATLKTIAEVKQLDDDTEVIIKGVVTSIDTAWDTSFKNMSVVLTDDTGSILVYRLATQVSLGDTITVTGKVGTYKEKQIAQGATAVIDIAHVCSEWNDATCEKAETCKVCGKVKEGSTPLGHIDENNDNVCDRCNSSMAALSSEVISVAGKTGALADDKLTISWTGTDFVVTNKKTSSSTAIRTDDADHYRVYQNSELVIAATNGKKISKIVVTCVSASYANVLKNSIGAGATAEVDGTKVIITLTEESDSITITATAQTRIKQIEIFYAE